MRQLTIILEQSLESIFAKIAINSREWQVLEARMDLLLTLEEVGKQFGGLTRERIRQLESKAKAKLEGSIPTVKPLLDFIEIDLRRESLGKISGSGRPDDLGEREILASKIQNALEYNDWRSNAAEIQRLILLVRGLVFYRQDKNRKSVAEKNWPRLTYLVCRLSPPILGHGKVAKMDSIFRKARQKLSYKEIASQILQEAGEPLHWRAISERGYQYGHRTSFSASAIYNTLQGHPDIFVRVGHGTYALAEWGMSEVDTYPDIISSILEQEKRTLSLETIYARVNVIRPVKRQTITMYLDMHPRFYRSIESTYGLRSWLPPRDRQTLRTSEWLIEDSDSFTRVERAIERGYKIQLESAIE